MTASVTIIPRINICQEDAVIENCRNTANKLLRPSVGRRLRLRRQPTLGLSTLLSEKDMQLTCDAGPQIKACQTEVRARSSGP